MKNGGRCDKIIDGDGDLEAKGALTEFWKGFGKVLEMKKL